MSDDSLVETNEAGLMGDEWSYLAIPRILHQTVKDKGNMPREWRDCRATWIKMLGPKPQKLGAHVDGEESESRVRDETEPPTGTTTENGRSTLWEFRLWDDYDNEEFVRTRYPQYYQ